MVSIFQVHIHNAEVLRALSSVHISRDDGRNPHFLSQRQSHRIASTITTAMLLQTKPSSASNSPAQRRSAAHRSIWGQSWDSCLPVHGWRRPANHHGLVTN